MKITDLKRSIDAYPEDRLRLLVTELYRALPKKLIEEKNIDQLILNTEEMLNERKKANKSISALNFETLRGETETFLQHAYKQNYFAPNKEIHKKDRPKWRFIVKRFTDQLIDASKYPEYATDASILLEKLYVMLCHASGSYLFSTEDPFNSVRITQQDYLRSVILLKSNCQLPQSWVREAIGLVVNEGTDHQTSTESLIEVVLEYLNTAPLKEMAIEQCQQLVAELQTKQPARQKQSRQSDYYFKEKLNHLQLIMFFCRLRLHEYDTAIDEYKSKNSQNKNNPEIDLYILLQYLYRFDLKDLWVREYKAAVNKGIKPREQLQRIYRYIGGNGSFPDSYYY